MESLRVTTLELATFSAICSNFRPFPGTGEGVGCQGHSEHDHWGHQSDCSNLPPEQEAADASSRHSIVERYMAPLGTREVVSYGDMLMASGVMLTGYQSHL